MGKIENDTIKFKVERVYFNFAFTSGMLFDCTFNLEKEFNMGYKEGLYNLLIKGSVCVDQLPTVSAVYPANWIQAFKERWFPKWILKKYPVKCIDNSIEIRAIYKDYKPKIKDEPFVINFKNDIGIKEIK